METTILDDANNDICDGGPAIDVVKGGLDAWQARATTFIKAHPGACLAGALALGYVIARVARRQRS